MKAVLYLRVSTEEQADSGAGLEAQLDAVQSCALRNDWETLGPFADEGVSGASGLDRRPKLIEAIGQLNPGDVLLVAKRDRLGRDPIAVAMIEAAVAKRKARVVSAAGEGTDGDDPASVLMRRMVDAFAEYELLLIRSRTRSALAAKRARGERTGQIPYGLKLDPDGPRHPKSGLPIRLIPAMEEVAVIIQVRDWRKSGSSLRWIAHELTKRGVPTKNGGPKWSHQSVAELLSRKDEGGRMKDESVLPSSPTHPSSFIPHPSGSEATDGSAA